MVGSIEFVWRVVCILMLKCAMPRQWAKGVLAISKTCADEFPSASNHAVVSSFDPRRRLLSTCHVSRDKNFIATAVDHAKRDDAPDVLPTISPPPPSCLPDTLPQPQITAATTASSLLGSRQSRRSRQGVASSCVGQGAAETKSAASPLATVVATC